jgi:hypothetical protein
MEVAQAINDVINLRVEGVGAIASICMRKMRSRCTGSNP